MPRRSNASTANGTRASVKTQRRVNQQSPPAKKNAGAQKENKQQNAPVGFSGVPLSSRFSSLQKDVKKTVSKPVKKAQIVVNVKKIVQAKGAAQATGRKATKQQKQQKEQLQRQEKQKMQQVAQGNRNKRQAAVNLRRKGLATPAVAKKPAATKQATKPKKKDAAKGKGAKSKEEKKAPLSGEDLDIEMDSYWHEAGKGPDPHQALLDRQMDQYWADKPKRDGEEAQPASA